MGAVGGPPATRRANRLGALEMPPGVTHVIRHGMTTILAPDQSFNFTVGPERTYDGQHCLPQSRQSGVTITASRSL
jgi:hypothetical protein